MTAILLLSLVLQDDVHGLVEKLRSESVEERDDAVRRLRAIGKPALPELEKAAKDPDAEMAARAKSLVRLIPLQEHLTPNLRRHLPALEERLSFADPHTWTEALFEAVEFQAQFRRNPAESPLKREDLEGLAPLAVRGAASVVEKRSVCGVIQLFGLRSAAPEVAVLLGDADQNVRLRALDALVSLRSPAVLPFIRKALRDPDPGLQALACGALGEMGEKSVVPDIALLLHSESAALRGAAVRSLGRLGAVDQSGKIGDLLADPVANVRYFALQALSDLEARGEVSRALRLLRDEDVSVRAAAIRAMESISGKEGVPEIRSCADDPATLVRMAAADTLCRLGDRDALPRFFELWEKYPAFQERDVCLESLNGIRRPEAWARLRGRLVREPLQGSVKNLRARLEKEAGMRVEWPDDPEFSGSSAEITLQGGRLSLLTALRILVPGRPQVIVEADRIRFLPHAEAVQFWLEWRKEK